MEIPEPHANLESGGGTQAEQTGNIILRFEKELTQNPADLALVVGDVLSTMVCAITAQKLHTKVAHVEAGIRSNDWFMPEEINRLVTEAITNYYFTTSEIANENLRTSGVKEEQIYYVGNTMIYTLFKNRLIYGLTENDKFIFNKLGVKTALANLDSPTDNILLKGNEDGCFIYRNKSVLLVFKRPIFNFRPSQSDAMHIDLWIGGQNVLRDGGSYSYNSSFDKSNYYNGVASHNTVQFDGRNQMPRFGRFLFGSWLKEHKFNFYQSNKSMYISTGYNDYLGAFHQRTITLKEKEILIEDAVKSFKTLAKINWRLNASGWVYVLSSENKTDFEINLISNEIKGDFSKSCGLESLFYHNESKIPVIYKGLNKEGRFSTKIIW